MRSTIGIGDITVQTKDLLSKLSLNRANHRRTFEAALERFGVEATKQFNEKLLEVQGAVRAGKPPMNVYINLPIPEEHTDDYDRAIRMLTVHTLDTVTLDERGYSQLMDDDWGWRDSFASNTTYYAEMQ